MVIEFLKRTAFFRNLGDDDLRRLAQGFFEQHLDSGATIYESGQPVAALYVVARGTVVVFRGGPGREQRPVARLSDGDLLGTADLFDSERYSETARTMEESTVLRGDKGALLAFLEDHPQLMLNLRLAAARDLTARAKVALGDARRDTERHKVHRMVRVQPAGAGALRLTLLDLSPYGMSLRGAPESWQPDTLVEYRLDWGERHLELIGRIAWRDGDSVGIDLEKPSQELRDELERMREAMLNLPI